MELSGENVSELFKNSLLYLEFLAEREEILQTIGDEVMATFADPVDAVSAAIDIAS